MAPQAFSLASYEDILRLHEKAFFGVKGAERTKLLLVIMDKITSDEDCKFNGPEEELKDVSLMFNQWVPVASSSWIQKIIIWYGNHKSIATEEPSLVQVGTSWNYRRVIQHEFKEDIAKKMEESGLKSTDKEWIQKFQQVVTDIIESMGGEGEAKKRYGETAMKWNEADLPEELRRK